MEMDGAMAGVFAGRYAWLGPLAAGNVWTLRRRYVALSTRRIVLLRVFFVDIPGLVFVQQVKGHRRHSAGLALEGRLELSVAVSPNVASVCCISTNL